MTVGRPPLVIRPCKLSIYLPEDLRAKLDLHLYSQLEGRIPHGAYSTFFAERVREFFNSNSQPDKQTLTEFLTEAVVEHSTKQLAFEGLVHEIALTDLRTGWNAEKFVDIVRRARKVSGKVPP